MTSQSITVTIVEDNAQFRSAVKLALESEADIRMLHQFATAEIAIQKMAESRPGELPNVILLDIRLPGMSGLDSIAKFLELSPQSKIIVLTQSDQQADVLRAISEGAAGYLLKSVTLVELIEGIRNVHNGDATLDAGVAKFILDTLQTKLSPSEQESLLSAREMQVLSLLAEGNVKKEIAKRLGIGYTTVDTHVSRIYTKLNVQNAPAAVNKAHLMKLFPIKD